MAHVYTASIQRVGRVEADGQVSDLHAPLAGSVTQDGRNVGFSAHLAGTVDAPGRLFDAPGRRWGRCGAMAAYHLARSLPGLRRSGRRHPRSACGAGRRCSSCLWCPDARARWLLFHSTPRSRRHRLCGTACQPNPCTNCLHFKRVPRTRRKAVRL